MASRKRTITKLTLAFAVAFLLNLSPQPLLSQSIDRLFRQGNAAQARGNFSEAERVFRQIIKINPNDAKAHNNLGIALRQQGKLDEAIASYQQAIKIDPNHADVHYNLGNALYNQGKLEEAIASYQQAIKIDPNYADAHYNLGIALRQQGKLDEAIASYQQAIKIDPNHADVHNALGYALQKQGKLDEAIKQYELSLKIDPDYVLAKNNRREARRLLALRLDPRLPEIDDTNFVPSQKDEPLVKILRSTARITAEVSARGINIGAGWVVKKEANTVWIVTNYHVVSDDKTKIPSKKIEVEFFSELPDEKRPRYQATIVGKTADNDELDLAVLKVTGIPQDIQPLEIRSGRIPRNTDVVIIGHPYNEDDPWSSERGIVKNYYPNNPKISLSGTFAQGNSGGPVLNEENQIVAMMVEIRTNSDLSVAAIDRPNLNININQPATGGIGLAYRIELIIEMLRKWGIID